MTSGNHVSFDIEEEFLKKTKEEFTGLLQEQSRQTQAWENQFDNLKCVLKDMRGRVIFEYGIPGLKKVIDVVLLIDGLIFVLEYKNGADKFSGNDMRQALGYALRLKYYHSNSNDRVIIPILVSTNAVNTLCLKADHDYDDVWDVSCCNSENLKNTIEEFCIKYGSKSERGWENNWQDGVFKSSPNIITAACNVWEKNNVKRITDSDVCKDKRLDAEKCIANIIKECSQDTKGKAIVFVTGVPGAGKTLVGLNVSVENQIHGASMISGNGPLVTVLSAALRRDLEKQYKENNLQDDVRNKYEASNKKGQKERDQEKNKISVDTIIRGAYAFKNEIINKRLSWQDKSYNRIVGSKDNSLHVVIFDEAQRAWSKEKMLNPGQGGKKEWQKEDYKWPFSEPGLLLWDMNQTDWCVFVCLVGGGQEINTGEAGISEWLRALKSEEYKDWKIYMSSNLTSDEYCQKDSTGKCVRDYVEDDLKDRITVQEELHLTETKRALRSELVSNFVNGLINLNVEPNYYKEKIEKYYKIYLTRDLVLAKKKLQELRWRLQSQKETFDSIEDIKMGMLMSSKAQRLRPLGYEVKKVSSFDESKVASWFLDKKGEDVNSCDALEVALNEFFVQGLELDLCCVMWDADFRYNDKTNSWDYYRFDKCKWNQILNEKITGKEKEDNRIEKIETNRKREIYRFYMKNAYRVLLTRARMGLIIYVPEGSKDDTGIKDNIDTTRSDKFYDPTYNYLKSLGLTELK